MFIKYITQCNIFEPFYHLNLSFSLGAGLFLDSHSISNNLFTTWGFFFIEIC